MNKSQLLILILIGIIFGLIFIPIRNYRKKISQLEQLKFQGKTDTIYIPEIFQIPEPYEIPISPSEIKIYEKDTLPKFSIFTLEGNDIILSNPLNNDSLKVSKNFINQFPHNSKLLNLELTRTQLNLGLLNISGIPQSYNYSIDLENYKYSYIENQLTAKKLSTFKKISLYMDTYYQYRIFNNFHDIGLNLNLDTKSLKYKIGINGFYYPKLQKNPGWDLTVGISYKF